jgi:hypothetical protein
VDNVGYVLAGYLLTAAALAAYVVRLMARARRAGRPGNVAGERPSPGTPA